MCPRPRPEEYLSAHRHGDAPFGAVAAGAGGELSLQSHRAGGGPGFLQGGRQVRQEARDLGAVSDLAYADIYFGDEPPPSILQVDGAKDIAIEFQSLSKTYSMPGWRMGFAAGNEKLIGALARIKSYLDYGAFTPIQVAAAAALNGPQDVVEEIRAVYKSRRDVLVKSMAQAGWDIPAPEASMFAWAPVPEKYREAGSMEFAKQIC